MTPEKYYENKRRAYQEATTVAELISAMADCDNPKVIEAYKTSLKKEINRKFKGNLDKAKKWAITQLNIAEHDFDEEQMIEWQKAIAGQKSLFENLGEILKPQQA